MHSLLFHSKDAPGPHDIRPCRSNLLRSSSAMPIPAIMQALFRLSPRSSPIKKNFVCLKKNSVFFFFLTLFDYHVGSGEVNGRPIAYRSLFVHHGSSGKVNRRLCTPGWFREVNWGLVAYMSLFVH
jgi:hypothetical protein